MYNYIYLKSSTYLPVCVLLNDRKFRAHKVFILKILIHKVYRVKTFKKVYKKKEKLSF